MATTILPFKHYFQEARRNPHLNPKVSINQRIKDHLDSARVLQGVGIPNSFVSFTKIEKLGLNPQSRYNTPLGIYAYQSVYVMEKAGLEQPMTVLPFVGDAPYANLFRVRGNIVNLSRMGQSEINEYKEKMIGIFLKYAGMGNDDYDEIKEMLDRRIFTLIGDRGTGYFWEITRLMSGFLTESHLTQRSWRVPTSRLPISWNKLFRELGIDGCVDEGEGIIHPNEPTQSVFFTTRAIASSERRKNKWSPETVGTGRAKGTFERFSRSIIRGRYNPREIEHTLRNSMEELIEGGLLDMFGMKLRRNIKNLPKKLQSIMLEEIVNYIVFEQNGSIKAYLSHFTNFTDVDISTITDMIERAYSSSSSNVTIENDIKNLVGDLFRNGLITTDMIDYYFVNQALFIDLMLMGEIITQIKIKGLDNRSFIGKIIDLTDFDKQLNAGREYTISGFFNAVVENFDDDLATKLVQKLEKSVSQEKIEDIVPFSILSRYRSANP